MCIVTLQAPSSKLESRYYCVLNNATKWFKLYEYYDYYKSTCVDNFLVSIETL